jgi:hypothetical protein
MRQFYLTHAVARLILTYQEILRLCRAGYFRCSGRARPTKGMRDDHGSGSLGKMLVRKGENGPGASGREDAWSQRRPSGRESIDLYNDMKTDSSHRRLSNARVMRAAQT